MDYMQQGVSSLSTSQGTGLLGRVHDAALRPAGAHSAAYAALLPASGAADAGRGFTPATPFALSMKASSIALSLRRSNLCAFMWR